VLVPTILTHDGCPDPGSLGRSLDELRKSLKISLLADFTILLTVEDVWGAKAQSHHFIEIPYKSEDQKKI
jgi:hypothetical protein